MSRGHGATETFALLSLIEAMGFWILEPGTSLLLAAGGAFIVGGLVGRAMWWLIVDSSNRWTTPIRGAIAGGLTGWIPIFPAAAVSVYSGQLSSLSEFVALFSSLNALLEFALGTVVFGLFGTIFVGWITIPTAAVVGYVLGRENDTEGTSKN